jgi:hypothetical protein
MVQGFVIPLFAGAGLGADDQFAAGKPSHRRENALAHFLPNKYT